MTIKHDKCAAFEIVIEQQKKELEQAKRVINGLVDTIVETVQTLKQQSPEIEISVTLKSLELIKERYKIEESKAFDYQTGLPL